MQKILITGGAGFIGSSLADELLKDSKNYIVLVDNLLTGKIKNLPSKSKNVTFIKADVNNYSDISPIMTIDRFDYVFHYAAIVGVERTLESPTLVLEDIDGIKNILDLSKNTGVKRVFFSSSSEVYGDPVETPQNEKTTPLNSRLPYAIVKNLGEAFMRSYEKEFGLNYTIFRFFNTFGPKQNLDFVMSIFINKALKGEPLPVIGTGLQTRTFCYIDDNIDACIKTMKNDKYANEIINIGSDIEVSIEELAKIIIDITKSKSKIEYHPARKEGDMQHRRPDISKMKKILKRDLTPLEKGIKKVVKEWKTN
ncbi:NAD-dependent epimerase/dehydratase family protein [Patescibacteria group bacterium]